MDYRKEYCLCSRNYRIGSKWIQLSCNATAYALCYKHCKSIKVTDIYPLLHSKLQFKSYAILEN